MQRVALFIVVLAVNLWGQTPPPRASTVPPDAAVVTIGGLCPAGSSDETENCKTVITRKQFDEMVDAVQPQMDLEMRQHLASSYPQFLIMAHEAESRGLDKSPHFEERMAFARLQILSQELVHQIQDEAARVEPAEIEAYYAAHKNDFEEATLERIVIPLRKETKPGTPPASPDDMKQEAIKIRARAAAGEDFITLQKAAFDFAGVSGNTSPNPKMAELRRRGLPPAHVGVFDLKPGEVSQVINDAAGHYVYKLDSMEVAPLDDVKDEITVTLRKERMKSMIEAVQKPFTVDVNHEYFDAKKK